MQGFEGLMPTSSAIYFWVLAFVVVIGLESDGCGS